VLRHGVGCCPIDCNDWSLVAVSKQVAADIEASACDGPSPCDACSSDPPSKAFAACRQGVCTVMLPP
jgi:hypothetical protein